VTSAYEEFLRAKKNTHIPSGIDVEVNHSGLFPFQRYVTSWALRTGKACVFAGTGLGKTRIQSVFANHLNGVRLILAPLAVAAQTVNEARELGVNIRQIQSGDEVNGDGIYIANYDRVESFEWVAIDAVILDESSIIKSHDGKYRGYIQDRFKDVPFKLCLTATPAPNDYMELGTHAEFVGAMGRSQMLAQYFTHDGADTSKWRLKKHARREFFDWVANWAMVFSHPSDIGFEQPGYDLPELVIREHVIQSGAVEMGNLFGDVALNATNLHSVSAGGIDDRVAKAAEIVASEPDEPWLIWVNTDAEQDAAMKAIPGLTSVRGSDDRSAKEDRLIGFASGKYPRLITKAKIAGFGMNWQHCARMIFCGVNYSFEQQYQAIRRCYRFGQKRPVHVHYVTCTNQEQVVSAVEFKRQAAASMIQEMKGVKR